ncbi:tetratricopeptide repeat protein [Crocinitomicaceae bacterium]|nr:tetratricopeptide repeat protein [Crocinitomicaceae bacterium]
MKKTLYILILLFTNISFVFTQEKRIALVIGNSDYQYQQKLKNPVRDAILMAQTLESLDFDVILDTNITTKRKFVKAISEFGAKRESYDVGFIFYAGHGMQVNGKNYILPTQEEFTSEAEVKEFAVGAEMVMEYLTKQTNQVNVLILDACRNNPIQKTRSVGVGGLAGMQAKGSLIAFSTTAGNVAKDGDGDHSIYCMSLVKNMLIEGISLDQVFRNVRKEVNELTGQGTVNYDQLTGNAFYLKRATYTDKYLLIDSLINAENYTLGLEITASILNEEPNNLGGLLRKGRLYYFLDKDGLVTETLDLAKNLHPKSKEVYVHRAGLLDTLELQEALKEIDAALQIDSNYVDAYREQASIYYNHDKFIEAVNSMSKAIELDSLNEDFYFSRAFIFKEMDSIILAAKDFEKVIGLDPEDLEAYYNLGVIHCENGLNEDALMDFEKVLEIDSTYVNAINYIGVIYKDLGIIDLAIKTYERGIALEQTDPLAAAYCYSNRAAIYETQEEFEQALSDYTKAIALDPENPLRYELRANFYDQLGEDEENPALIDYSRAIDLDKENPERWSDRAEFHYYAGHDQDALKDFNKLLELDSTNIDAINTIGLIYVEQGKIDLAIQTYERGIALEKTDPIAASYCYRNRGIIYRNQEKYQKAIDDFTKTIDLDPNTASRYIDRANCYRDMNENEKALEDYDMAIQVDPKDAENWYWRGSFLFYFMSDYKGAIRDLEKSISLNPSDIYNYIWLGELYYEIEDYAKSIEISLKGLEVDKNDISGLELLYETISDSYYDMGNIDKALEYIDKHLSLSPRPLITEWKGEIYEHDLNEPYTALNLYTAGINIDSSCYYCWDSRARLYGKKLHNYEMAIKDFKYITTYIDTNDVIELNWIGVYYHRLGEEEKAKEYYNKVIQKYNAGIEFNQNEINGGVAWSFNNLGVYNERDNDYVAAQKFYNKAIEINAQYPDRYYWRGWFYFNCLKKYDLALLDIQQAIDLDPENSKWVLCKANMLEKANRLSQAEDIYDLAKKLFPKDQNVQLERARFLGISGKLKSSEKEFKKLQHHKTLDAEYLNYQIEMYIKNKDFNEAKKLARECLNLYPKDTISRMYLADIYFEEQNFSASCMNYTYLISMMENNDNYLEYEPHLNQINLSELYIKQANTFEKVQDQQSQCEALKKALSNLKNMYGIYNKKELQKELENKIQSLCTP